MGPCKCGCGQQSTGDFLPGHEQRLRDGLASRGGCLGWLRHWSGGPGAAGPRPRAYASASPPSPISIYLRPNLGSTGAVPAPPPLSTCPDIWVAGSLPMPNFQAALAAPASYQQQSLEPIVPGVDYYVYVRGMNGGTAVQSVSVTLYFAPSNLLEWQSIWGSNVIPTDGGSATASITAVAPGQVGVADAAFVWRNVPPPPPGSDHYCLIAQLNDANDSNPFPDVGDSFDMGELVANNLGWGWLNV